MTEQCKHFWDKSTGVFVPGKQWIGLKGRWIRTCTKCGYQECFSRGTFNGWFSYGVKEEQK
jgi:hypothetical protein